MRFRALPEQDTVLRVEYDILLAVGDAHCSEFNQHKLGRTSENEHMAEFEEVGACVGVHFVQTSLDPLPERQDWYCARNLVLRRRPVVVIILAGGQGTIEKAAGFLPPFVSGGLGITRCGHAVFTLLPGSSA